MIELGLLSTKTSFDIAETFAIGELSKRQTKELIPAGEIFDVTVDNNTNADMVWVNNAGSAANIDFAIANVGNQPPDDFSISVNSAPPSAYSGQTVTFNVTTQAIGTFNSALTLGCNDFPEVMTAQGVEIKRSDFSCTFNPASGSINPGSSATVSLAIPPGFPAEPFSFAINGTSGGTTHRVKVTVTDLGLAGSVQPASATLAVGASANFNVTIINPNAFAGTVSFLCNGQPAWIQCAFNPSSMAPSANSSSVMTVTVVSVPTGAMLSYPPSTRRLPAQRNRVLWSVTFAALCLIAMAMISIGRHEKLSAALLLRGFAVMALTLVLAVGLVSCGGAAGPSTSANLTGGSGANGSGGGGGARSNPVTGTFTVQAQSANGITNLGTVSITTQ